MLSIINQMICYFIHITKIATQEIIEIQYLCDYGSFIPTIYKVKFYCGLITIFVVILYSCGINDKINVMQEMIKKKEWD